MRTGRLEGVPFLSLSAAHRELEAELDAAALRVLRSGRYLAGAEVEAFEAEFARYCGAPAAVGVGNGLEALRLTLLALGIGAGDEVLVSAHTSIATWLAISHAGATPVPVEPDPDTMQIDPSRVPEAVGARTAAIVAVHLYGMPAPIDSLSEIARGLSLALVEDASQAHGASIDGRRVGSLGDAAAFSLYPTKNLGAAGDAGIVTARDPQLVARIRQLANYGERERHRSEVRGYNSRLDELQAALLRVKLRRLDEWNDRRRARAHQYLAALDPLPSVGLPSATPAAAAVWHQFVIRAPERDALRELLARRGVPTLVHYPVPPHLTPAYAEDPHPPLPITEALAGSVLSLPISPQLSPADCGLVCEEVAQCAGEVAGPATRAALSERPEAVGGGR